MNFNLISPENEGHLFTSRFQEDITIPKEASIYMNFAKLQRDVRIVLEQQNTIDLLLDEPIPFRNIQGTEAYENTTPGDRSITIPPGTYSVQDLQQRISLGTQQILDQGTANSALLKNNFARMYNAGGVSLNPFLQENAGTDHMKIGVERNMFDDEPIITPTDEELNNLEGDYWTASGTNGVNAGQNGGAVGSYRKTNGGVGNLSYDNFGIDDKKFYHYGTNIQAWENYKEGVSTGAANTRDTSADRSSETDKQMANYPYFEFTTEKTYGQQKTDNGAAATRGGNFVGLYSNNYATGTPQNAGADTANQGFVANGVRTRGTTLRTTTLNGHQYPVCYIGFEVGHPADLTAADNVANQKVALNVVMGANAGGNCSNRADDGELLNPLPFPHIGAVLDRVVLAECIHLDDTMLDDDEPIRIIVIPMYKLNPRTAREGGARTSPYDGFVNRRELHFQVILRSTNSAKGDQVLYDSLAEGPLENKHIAGEVIDGYEVSINRGVLDQADPFVAPTPNEITTQMPFNLIVASKDNPAGGNGAGLLEIEYSAIPNRQNLQNLFPTIIDGLRYRFSGELGSVIKQEVRKTSASATSTPIYPSLRGSVSGFFNLNPLDNSPDNLTASFAGLVYLNSLYQQGELQSYSIYINNIPLRNYKNRMIDLGNKGQAGGIKKNLLKSLPIPFYSGFTTAQIGNERICSYEPAQKEVSELKNQEFKTNNFTIEIRDLETDKPATDIKHAVINFTIVEKDSKLIN